ncbi:MAG TPA: SGNH/GDSL hydrolase family protein [Planctomycetota bacterium]|jgi:lysophospholipase L1-like esterase
MTGMPVVLASCLLVVLSSFAFAEQNTESTPSFADFDKRAKSGARLNVVFFGASLTWGANASDPQLTSYRALIGQRLEQAYPQARFKFWDGAIGGTGSQLGVFRFEREVLRHKPDLVFLDFSANDDIYSNDPETLASYESLVRRIIVDAHAPCVQVIFPFLWNVSSGKLDGMKRRDAHLAIAKAYNAPAGDAIELAQKRVKAGETTTEKLWPVDGVHPCDDGYVLFADAAWQAFQGGVEKSVVCAAPEKMLYAPTYMKNARVRISSLGNLPAGWRVGRANLVSAFFDMLMSRWLDDETIASNRKEVVENGKKQSVPQQVEKLSAKFSGSMVLFFGESTPKSCKYRVYIDGKVVEHTPWGKKEKLQEFDAGDLAKKCNGNTHMVQVIATGLDDKVEHTLEIEPLMTGDAEQEIRLESICVAGGEAKVSKQ